MKNKKLRTRILAVMLVLVMLISVGYAALTTTLQVVGNATIKKNTWSIYFDNVVINPANSVASVVTNPTTSGTTTTVLNWEVNMDTPGQVYEFNVDMVNAGSIDAMIGSLSNTALTTNQAKYLDYIVKYENGAAVEAKDKLAAGERKTITVRLAFKTDINPSDLPQQGETGITLTFNIPDYKQADNTAVEKQTAIQYTVTFYDEDGTTVLGTSTVNKGTAASFSGETPTKAADASYTYEFDNWYTTNDGTGVVDNLSNVIANRSVYAKYTATEIPSSAPEIGSTVNYSTTLNNVTLDNWKVFYNENGYTYLIYGDYLRKSAVPAFTGKQTSDTYGVCTNTNRADLINGLSNKESYDSLLTGTLTVNGETKQIAETRTANVWAMGAPTLELWVNSWNTSYPSDTLYAR